MAPIPAAGRPNKIIVPRTCGAQRTLYPVVQRTVRTHGVTGSSRVSSKSRGGNRERLMKIEADPAGWSGNRWLLLAAECGAQMGAQLGLN
eukprot:3362229-Amphidinium_carterae.1